MVDRIIALSNGALIRSQCPYRYAVTWPWVAQSNHAFYVRPRIARKALRRINFLAIRMECSVCGSKGRCNCKLNIKRIEAATPCVNIGNLFTMPEYRRGAPNATRRPIRVTSANRFNSNANLQRYSDGPDRARNLLAIWAVTSGYPIPWLREVTW